MTQRLCVNSTLGFPSFISSPQEPQQSEIGDIMRTYCTVAKNDSWDNISSSANEEIYQVRLSVNLYTCLFVCERRVDFHKYAYDDEIYAKWCLWGTRSVCITCIQQQQKQQ
uniref:Uncharacterized protein n=1 Tax=Glossina pallidipes TaxID=7398 RepID=A0A1A9ZBM9_GLOPL